MLAVAEQIPLVGTDKLNHKPPHEVEKCGTLCGGVTTHPGGRDYDKDVEVEKCGNICAAAK